MYFSGCILSKINFKISIFSANSQHDVESAIRTIRSIIKDAIENPEGQNDLRKTQLMELARLNGTLREGIFPSNFAEIVCVNRVNCLSMFQYETPLKFHPNLINSFPSLYVSVFV